MTAIVQPSHAGCPFCGKKRWLIHNPPLGCSNPYLVFEFDCEHLADDNGTYSHRVYECINCGAATSLGGTKRSKKVESNYGALTVRELLEKLHHIDLDTPVFRDNDGSLCEVTNVTYIEKPNTDYSDVPYVLLD